ncbi:MAG: Gfo/Idh/MocA family oxidoreductase [Candidatus Marinimicrobia bacterium]|nr:Gfo/Idh/MocA family oxidoreductase [Candidatus Neomarinimicrobiota bacterium]
MKKQINVGLIGTGRLGSMYAEFLVHLVPQAKLVAVADLIPERAMTIVEKYDIPKWYDNHHDLNSDPNVDAVIITATTMNHKEIVLDAVSERKPIFCEKPMSLNIDDARAMKSAVEAYGVFYQQGYMRRFDKGFAAAKQKIDAGVIGTPVVFRGSSRDTYLPTLEYLLPQNSGGQILDMAIHDFDIARWYMGNVKTVYAIGGVLAYPEVTATGDTDNVVMAMTFESGTLGEVDISRNGIYGYDIRAEVLGTKGTLKVGYLRDTPLLVLTAEGVTHDVVPYFPERFHDAYIAQLNNYLGNLQNGNKPMITIDDGVTGLQIAVAATDSLHTNRVVRVIDY